MSKKMLIDATHAEETRVAVVDGHKLIDYDYESKVRKQLKGSIFLAKVTRVEPSLQAAFVNFGGNRHAFLPFSEIHPDYFRIPIADREALLAEQEAEMEALRAEEEAEEAAEAAAGGGGEGAAEDDEEEEVIEEIGGEKPSSGLESLESGELPAETDESAFESSREDRSEEEEDDNNRPENGEDDFQPEPGNEALSDEEAEVNGNVLPEDPGNEPDGNRPEGENRDRHGGRGHRRGRGGRGRHHHRDHRGGGRGGRMESRSRRVEILGGDGVDGDRPVRPTARRNYKIQEVIKRGQIMLIQVSKEERGNKGAAVTTYLSLPGRYCVLMPNSPRAGGVSRKIANFNERRRMREILAELQVPGGMSVIMRTAGMSRNKTEIKRDLDYLMKLWDSIRELTLKSTAPALVHEEGNLIRRAIRDIYGRDISEIIISGDEGFKLGRDFMRMMIPSHAKNVKQYDNSEAPLFHRFQVESQIAAMSEATMTLKSGGYLVINPTEALVSIDVNSGRATRERHIEETALKTNLEAADEVARQLRLRDLGGLVVIDFIDMEDRRNNRKVENRLRDALSSDRARIQMGRISSFGLLEMSRQRLNPSLTEAQFEKCSHCKGMGHVRTIDSAAIMALRALEEEGIRSRASEAILKVPNVVALYILNNKRTALAEIEKRYGFAVRIVVDESLMPSGFAVDHVKGAPAPRHRDLPERDDSTNPPVEDHYPDEAEESFSDESGQEGESQNPQEARGEENREGRQHGGDRHHDRDDRGGRNRRGGRRRGRRGGRGRGRFNDQDRNAHQGGGENRHHRDSGSEGSLDSGGSHAPQEQTAPSYASDSHDRFAADAGATPHDDSGNNFSVRETPQQERSSPASNDREPPAPRDYERVNEPPAQKKRGWWGRKQAEGEE